MPLLYSQVPPLRMELGQKTLPVFFREQAEISTEIYIATGYASKSSLLEIENIMKELPELKIKIVLGMYYIEGCPEGIYNNAVRLNEEWKATGRGEIRITKSIKYHGKLYCFYKNGEIQTAVIGSHNLGALIPEAHNLRQYEISLFTENKDELKNIDRHIKQVIKSPISVPFEEASDMDIVHEENTKLEGVENVAKIGPVDVAGYIASKTNISFDIPLKVPGIPGSTRDYMKSNINKCYAKGRLNSKTGVVTERGWWETEVIVSNSTTSNPDYPEKNEPFYAVTDDGWKFKMHASGDHKKNLESHNDLKILGYWLKGRLVSAGIIQPVDSPSLDLETVTESGDIYKNCKGVITYQKLLKYGRTSLSLTKTTKTIEENNTKYNVWVLSFLPDNVK